MVSKEFMCTLVGIENPKEKKDIFICNVSLAENATVCEI